PGAAAITKVKLLRGDGHILLAADCAKSQIQIGTLAPGNPDNQICFTVTGTTGNLSLQLPDVFYIQTSGGRSVRAGLTSGSTSQTVDVPTNGFKPVGVGSTGTAASLVELTVTG
ncbi:hypothetical protein ABZW03_30960, partial [Kitasatospora sp. NPDC004799]